MVLLPVTGNRPLGGLQLLSQLDHLGGKRGVGVLGRRYLGLHFDVPIAIHMRIYDSGARSGDQAR